MNQGASQKSNQPRDILLLGGGYVLSKLAEQLPVERFVITCTSAEKTENFRALGYTAEKISLDAVEDRKTLQDLYPDLRLCIDSVPPLPNSTEYETRGSTLQSIFSKNPGCIFYLSSTGVYGMNDGSWVTEETPCLPLSPSGEKRLTCEKSFTNAGIPHHIFRIAGIYGPGRGIAESLRSGNYRLLEGGNKWSNRIHRDDIVSALLAALRAWEKGLAFPRVLNLCDDYPSTQKEIVAYYCKKFDLPYPVLLSKKEAEQESRHRLLANQRVSNSLLRKSLLPQLQYPSFREGAATECPATSEKTGFVPEK